MQPLNGSFIRSSVCTRCLIRLHRQVWNSRIRQPRKRAYHNSTPFRSIETQTSSSSRPLPLPKQLLSSHRTLLTTRALLQLTGPDASKLLQGLVTANIDPSSTRQSLYCGFLNAQGRIGWDAVLYPRREDGAGELSYFIEVESGEPARLLQKHLGRHKLRSKVKIALLGAGEAGIVAEWGGDGQADGTPADPRLAELGTRQLLRGEELSGLEKSSEEDIAQYTLRRYLHGVPEGSSEIIPFAALPQESNMDFLEGVDFRKGCYVGQELTIRTQHTGVVRKRILPVMLYEGTAPDSLQYTPDAFDRELARHVAASAQRSPISIAREGARGRSTGKLLANVGNIGLALCRLEMMTDLRVSAEGANWKEGDEFTLKDDEESGFQSKGLKIKAFVPGWLRSRIEAEWEKKRERAERNEVLT